MQNIRLTLDADNLGASVESGANYSEALEFGTSKMAARPFCNPLWRLTGQRYGV